jgi:hypothetical protein
MRRCGETDFVLKRKKEKEKGRNQCRTNGLSVSIGSRPAMLELAVKV